MNCEYLSLYENKAFELFVNSCFGSLNMMLRALRSSELLACLVSLKDLQDIPTELIIIIITMIRRALPDQRQHCRLKLFWLSLTNTESETSRLVYLIMMTKLRIADKASV